MSDGEQDPPPASTSSTSSGTSTTTNSTAAATAATPRSALPPFQPFDPSSDPSTVGQRWKKWVRRFENLLLSLREFDPTIRRGLLLTYVGDATNDVFDILPDTGTTYESAVTALNQHFDPMQNKDLAVFEFRELRQEINETLNDFYRRLKTKASDCSFTNTDDEIRTQIIHKTRDKRLRRRALRESFTLQELLNHGRSLERTDEQAKKLEGENSQSPSLPVNAVETQSRFPHGNSRVLGNGLRNNRRKQDGSHNGLHNNRRKQKPPSRPKQSTTTCRNCGGRFPHKGGMRSCPAQGTECHKCHKLHHFAKFCLSSKPQAHGVQHVTGEVTQPELSSSETDDEYLFTIHNTGKHPETTVIINGVPVKVIVDSGASVNVLNHAIVDRIKEKNANFRLTPSSVKIHAYGTEQPLDIAGQFTASISTSSGKSTEAIFFVSNSKSRCLLGFDSSTALDLLSVNLNNITIQHEDSQVHTILTKHCKLFMGTGNLKNTQVKLEIDESVTPVAQPPRRIPHSMKSKVNSKLEEMRNEGIIEKVQGATPWLSPLIAVPKKNGDVRLVLDMRMPNTALTRRRVQIPTVNEILQQMEGATIFSEVDLSQGYLQLTLAEESRYITAFSTPDNGPHRFTRLIMGASPSGEHFHEIIHDLIREIPGTANISDNIWIWSRDKTTHLNQLDQLLTKLEDSGITLKLPKCSFAVPQINVFGHIVSANGIQPDEKKIKAIAEAPHPTNASEVRSFLGLTNYCSRYIQDYSTLTFPLRQLTKANTSFEWHDEHETAFQNLKQALTSSPILAHYSLNAKTRVVVDASPWAVGAVLLQEQTDKSFRPVAYGSRSLTDTERKYGQIEKEALAIVFGCEHFHMYLFGREFELETDHRPLEHIYAAKPTNTSKPQPARIERWRLRLQEYDFKVVYRPGKTNLADPLSRLANQHPRSNMESCADRYVNYMTNHLAPRAMSVEEIQKASLEDPELRAVRELLTSNQVYKMATPYKTIADELCITDHSILLRGTRIVLPTTLREQAITLAHEDHAGMTRCKQRLRAKLWWPNMDKEIEDHIKSCHPCQTTARPPRPEPMQPTELPNQPWLKLALDICGPFPTGEYVAVLTDYYSRWPSVKILKSVTSTSLLNWLDAVFAEHGYPEEIKTDNASYFTSAQFKETLASWGVKATTVTEYWPQANGQVERFNKVLEKHIQTATIEGKDWRRTLPTMLLNYRTTPHRMTGETPAKLLMQRELRTKLPSVPAKKNTKDSIVRSKDAKEKDKAKAYADRKRHASHRNLKIGDFVLVTQRHTNKYSTKFHRNPMKIVKIHGTQIIIEDGHGTQHRRNISHVKLFVQREKKQSQVDTPDLDDDDITIHRHHTTTATPPCGVTRQPQAPTSHSPTPIPGQPAPRRSARQRSTPAYLKDYVAT